MRDQWNTLTLNTAFNFLNNIQHSRRTSQLLFLDQPILGSKRGMENGYIH